MRISLVVYGSLDRITGGNIYDRQLVDRLRLHGDSVEIISLQSRGLAARALDNVWQRLPRDLDVLLQDELTHLSMLLPTRRERRYPVVSIVHNLHSSERRPRWQNAVWRRIEGTYLNSVDGIVFNSQTTRASVHQVLHLEKPCLVAPPGGDRLGTLDAEAIKLRSQHAGALRILFLANVTRLKGLHVLLEALALLDASRFELDVVGSCDTDPDYARAMRRRGQTLRSRITFRGSLDGEPLAAIMQTADVMVIPSYYEGFGISFLEGMAFGLPAIGTFAGAMPEMIKPDENGFLIQPGDASALARRLRSLDADRALLRRMSLAALEFFRNQPTWDASGDRVRQFLVDLIGSRSSGEP